MNSLSVRNGKSVKDEFSQVRRAGPVPRGFATLNLKHCGFAIPNLELCVGQVCLLAQQLACYFGVRAGVAEWQTLRT